MAIRFYVKKWVSEDLFKKLVSFSDYLGRDHSRGSVFSINFSKISENNLDFYDILEVLEEAGAEIERKDLEELKKRLLEEKSIYLEWLGDDVVLRTGKYLGKDYEHIRNYITYDRLRKLFIVKPLHFFELKKALSSLGYNVIDKTGLSEELKLPFKITFKGELRDYQKEALEKWIENNRKGIIALPTGSGKTVIAIAALAELSERTLIVTYTKEQMFQWKDMIAKFTTISPNMIGLYYGEEKRIAPITISTYQTAYRKVKILSKYFSFLIIDECHHLPAEKFKHIALNMFSIKRMGLSATVIREDGKHEELFPLMGGIAYFKTPSELSAQGYLAPYVIYQVEVNLTPKEMKKYFETVKLYRELSGGKKFEELLELAKKGDERAQMALRVHSKLRQIVHKAEAKKKAVKEIVERELRRGSKIIVFTQYVDQAKELGEILNAPVLVGEIKTKIRRRILEEFRSGKEKVLVVTTVGDEGLDIPDANVGIIVTGTGSRRQFIQRLGRLLRPSKGKEARLYEIIVRGTSEVYQARKRKSINLSDFLY